MILLVYSVIDSSSLSKKLSKSLHCAPVIYEKNRSMPLAVCFKYIAHTSTKKKSSACYVIDNIFTICPKFSQHFKQHKRS